jgi:hypothetical protein
MTDPTPAEPRTDRGPTIGRQGWHFADCWRFWTEGLSIGADSRCICSGAPAPRAPVGELDDRAIELDNIFATWADRYEVEVPDEAWDELAAVLSERRYGETPE